MTTLILLAGKFEFVFFFSSSPSLIYYVHVRVFLFILVATGKEEVASVNETPQPSIARYLEDASFGYSDFASRDSAMDISTFKVQDYSWEEHGFSLINRLYPDIGQMLDDKFSCTVNLTYNT